MLIILYLIKNKLLTQVQNVQNIKMSFNTGVSYNNIGNAGKCFAGFATVTENYSLPLRFLGFLKCVKYKHKPHVEFFLPIF